MVSTLAAPANPFPAPTGFAFPPPPAAADPSFGVNPYGSDNMYLLQQGFAQNTADLMKARFERQQLLSQSAQLAAVNTQLGAGALDSNPLGWTPEEAQAQTDRAIAKISTVNPKLAEQLSAQRTGQDSGSGFFDGLKSAIGEVVGGGLSAFGKVFDIIGRTAHIVPNLAFDLADGGDFAPGHDLAGALTGDLNHGWHDVLDQTVGHETGIWGAIAGLVGDIATDPLTWLWPAGAGAKLGEVAEQGGRVAATELLAKRITTGALPEYASMFAGKTEAEIVSHLTEHWSAVRDGMASFGRAVGVQSAELDSRAWAFMDKAASATEIGLRRQLWEVGDQTARLIRARGFKTAVRDGLVLSDGANIGARDIKSLFETMVKSGRGASVRDIAGKDAWHTAESMASVVGGARLKIRVPYTSFRYISSPLFNASRFMPHATGQVLTRFLAGQSGLANLTNAITTQGLGEEGWNLMRDWMSQGWDVVARNPEYTDILSKVRGSNKGFGSMFYSASEKVGGITAHFGTGTAASRAGLVYQWAHNTRLTADNAKRAFIRDLWSKTVSSDKNMARDWEAHGVSVETAKHTIDPADEWAIANYMSYFPTDIPKDLDAAGVEAYYRQVHPEFASVEDDVAQGAVGGANPDFGYALTELQKHQARLAHMQATYAGPPSGGAWSDSLRDLMHQHQARWDVGRETAGFHGAQIGNVKLRLDDALSLHETQVETWRAGQGLNHPVTRGEFWLHAEDAQGHQALQNFGVTEDHRVIDEHLGAGVRVSTKKVHPDDVRVVIRGADLVELAPDEAGVWNATLPGGLEGGTAERTLNDVRTTSRQFIDGAADALGMGPDGTGLGSLDRNAIEGNMLSEAMKADRPKAVGAFRRLEDGTVEASIWDTANVKRVGAEHVANEVEGFYPRYINEETSRYINGVVPKGDAQVLLSEPRLRAEIERKTLGMTLDEAEAQTRLILEEKFKHLGQDAIDRIPKRLIESHILKADALYIDRLATDISAQIIGRGAYVQSRLGRLAPFMFVQPPRAQEYEWNLSKGFVALVKKSDATLGGDILRLKARESAYLNALHRTFARQAEGFGHLALLTDEGGVLPDPELEAVLRYGETKAQAYGYLDDAERTTHQRLAALDAADEEHLAARDEFVAAQKEVVPPEQVAQEAGATQAEKVSKLQTELDDVNKKLSLAQEKDAQAKAAAKAREYTDKIGRGTSDDLGQLDINWTPMDEAENKLHLAKLSKDKARIKAAQAKVDELVAQLPEHEQKLLKATKEYQLANEKVDKLKQTIENIEDRGGDTDAAEDKLEAAEEALLGAEDRFQKAQAESELLKAMDESTAVEQGAEGVAGGEDILAKSRAATDPKRLELISRKDELEALLAEQQVVGTTTTIYRAGDENGVWWTNSRAEAQKYADARGEQVVERTVNTADLGEGAPSIHTKGARDYLNPPEAPPKAPTTPEEVDALVAEHTEQLGQTPEHTEKAMRAVQSLRGQGDDLGGGLRRFTKADGKVYYTVEDADRVIGYRTVLTDGRVETGVDAARRGRGEGSRMLEAHWEDAGVNNADNPMAAAADMVAKQKFSPEGAALNAKALKRRLPVTDEETIRNLEARFEREVENGQLYRNAKTGSLYTREGNLVAKGGGKLLRPAYQRQLERDDLAALLDEFGRARTSLDEGSRFNAPEAAQVGERAPGVQRTAAERATYKTQQASERLNLAAKSHGKATAEATAAGKTLGRLRTRLNDTMNAVNKAYAEARGVRAEMKPALVPIETSGDLGNLTRLRVPGLEGYAMPPLIADEWHAVIDKFGPSDLTAAWRHWVLGPWKRWATYRWPGFHVRNFYGAWFNNYLGGVRNEHYDFSWRVNNLGNKAWDEVPVEAKHFDGYKLGRLFGSDTKGTLTYGDVKEHLSQLGIGSGNNRSVMETADSINGYREGLALTGKNDPKAALRAFRAVDEKMRNFGGGVEDYHRVAAWARGMETVDGDTMGARAFVMMRHGDYADLTPAEDHIRDLIPFYKWLSTNVPYQVRMLAEDPGKLALVSRAREFAYDAQGLDKTTLETQQPGFMRETLSLPIPSWVPVFGSKGPDAMKYAMFDLPYNDLYNGFNDYISAAVPYFRNVVESYGFHEQAFTGKPLTGRMNKLSGVFNLPGVRDLLAATPFVSKGQDGGLYIQDRVENLLTAWPIYSRFRNFVEADPARVSSRLNGLLSTVAGVGVRESDATAAELDFYYNQLEPTLQAYRDMGVVFPSAQDFVDGGKAISPPLPSFTPPASGVYGS